MSENNIMLTEGKVPQGAARNSLSICNSNANFCEPVS